MAMRLALIRDAIEHYREDVEHRAFPSDEESYHLPAAARKELRRFDEERDRQAAYALARPDGGFCNTVEELRTWSRARQ